MVDKRDTSGMLNLLQEQKRRELLNGVNDSEIIALTIGDIRIINYGGLHSLRKYSLDKPHFHTATRSATSS